MLVRNGCSLHRSCGLDEADVLRELTPLAAIAIASLRALAYRRPGNYSGCFIERDRKQEGDGGLPQSPNRSVAAVVVEPVSNSCALPFETILLLVTLSEDDRVLSA